MIFLPYYHYQSNEREELMGNIIIDRMLKRIEEGNLKREDWEPDILAFEITLNRYLKEKGYTYEKEKYLVENPDEKLRLLLEKEKEAYEKPIFLLPEGIKAIYDKFNTFLDFYHIGFVHDFKLNQNGMIEIALSLHIYSPSTGLGRNDVAEKANYEAGIKRLNGLGMTLVKSGGFNIQDTESNKKIILDVLKIFCEPKLIRFSTREDIFDKIIFLIHPKDIKELPVFHRAPVTDEIIRKNTLLRLEKLIKELYHAIGSINSMPELTNTCGYIVESCFSEVCDLLGITTELANTYHERYMQVREINRAIHDKEKQLGNIITMNQITPLAKELFESIRKNLREIGYSLNDGTCMTIFKGLKVNASCIPSCSYYDAYLFDNVDIDECADKLEKQMEGMFDMIEPFPGERYVAFTEKNLNVITGYIRDFYQSELEDLQIENKKGALYIKSFSFYINDLTACV